MVSFYVYLWPRPFCRVPLLPPYDQGAQPLEKAMRDKLFKVVFTGRLTPGKTQHQVRCDLARVADLPPQVLDNLFSRKFVIRSGIDRKAAWRCWELFRRAGALCQVEPMGQVTPTGCNLSPATETQRPEMRCPHCQRLTENSVICSLCGIDIALYRWTSGPTHE